MKFNVLVIDPPYQYRNKNVGHTMISGAENKYKTMSHNDLLDLKPYIEKVTKQDAVIFLWVTNPMLKEGLALIEHYGFKYKTLLTWVKTDTKSMGYWFRGNTEHMILGIKGIVEPFHCQEINVFHSPIKGHSVKPSKSYELIELATSKLPDRRILEMFARNYRKDWVTIGKDLDDMDIVDSLKRLNNK